jgi:hypothetical protein
MFLLDKIWYKAFVLVFILQALFMSGCVVSVPVGGTVDDRMHEVIIQTSPKYIKALEKDYRQLNFTTVKQLSYQVGTYLILISIGDQSPDLVISTLERDIRITQAEWNKPYERRD